MSVKKTSKFPIISVIRKIVQLTAFILINFVAFELIFPVDLSIFKESLGIFPFLHTPRDAWSTGAGVLEYIFYSIGHGIFPFLLIGILLLIILFTGRFFCGWICPVGFIQDLTAKIPNSTKKMSIETDRTLKKVKYWIVIIVLIILFSMGILKNTNEIAYMEYNFAMGEFLDHPLGSFSLSEFLFYTLPVGIISFIETMSFEGMFGTGWAMFGFIFYAIIIVVSAYYPRFYCRVLCPFAGVCAPISKNAFLKFSRNPVKCTGRRECGICEDVCPKQIRILDEDYHAFTGNGECNLCGICKEKCPYDAIHLKFG
ncbi:MAG: 4Fe-4S binding protein [Promethearchaeota archaeon]